MTGQCNAALANAGTRALCGDRKALAADLSALTFTAKSKGWGDLDSMVSYESKSPRSISDQNNHAETLIG
jgi:hypothetical protein